MKTKRNYRYVVRLGFSHASGQAMTEFLIIAALVGLALALGSPSPLEQVISALQRFYIRFSTAMSMP